MVEKNLDIGYVFERTFRVIGGRFVELLLLAIVLVGLPTILIYWLNSEIAFNALSTGNFGIGAQINIVLLNIAVGLLPVLLQAAAVNTTVEAMSGRPSDFGSSLSVALGAFVPVLVLSIIISLATTIGLLLFIFPGLILMTFWAVVIPAFVAENTGIMGAFSRSVELTEGQRWRIFGLMVLAWLALLVIGFVLGFLSLGFYTGGASGENLLNFNLGNVLMDAIINTTAGIVSAVGVSVLYVHLRELKEGMSADTISDVFG